MPWHIAQISPTWDDHLDCTDDDSVLQTIPVIEAAIERKFFKASVLGLLLGMHCTRPYQVPVPLRAPLDSASIFDTDCSAYVSRCISSGWRLSHFDRAHVDKFPPDSDYFLPNAYTFFYCDTISAVAQNRLVKSSFSVAKVHSLQWFGNILVLKHSDHYPTGGHGLVDVHPQEYWLLEEIIEWLVSIRFDCGPRHHRPCPPLPLFSLHIVPPPAYAIPCPENSAMLAVLQTTELAQLILGHCGCNSLANFALCNKFSYSLVSGFFASRLRIILGLFLPDKATQLRFLCCLDSLRSFIAGSAAFWFLNPRASFAFDNMNIICPVGTHHEWVSFFASLSMPRLHYVEPAGHFNRHTSSALHYRSSQGNRISVYISRSDTVARFMLDGFSTAECVLLGSKTAYTLYPSLMEENIVMPLHTEQVIPLSVQSELVMRSAYHENTSSWNKPCGECCALRWRSTTDGRDIWRFYWDALSPVSIVYDPPWGNYEWRRGECCGNPFCGYSTYGTLTVISPPRTTML
ncbi:hypothetical protein F5877DRAFT_78962 [Lentinula edodes]|nr:hypothetical protein F5877DRAFT_78962 [Lentinula edodes]